MDEALNIFRALADPTRLRIMLLLLKMELAVGELAQILEQSQPRISRHIRILDEAGLAQRRKEGSWVFLRPGPAGELDVLRRIFDSEKLAASPQALSDSAKLSDIRTARAAMAEQYFAAHAEEWDAIRSLHVAEAEVEAAMRELWAGHDIGHLLDIGTGTGRIVEIFGPEAEHITAIDKSPEMLRLARAKLVADDAVGGKTDLQHCDFEAIPLETGSVDHVVMHQVLHYAQHPEAVLIEVARVLQPGGCLLIADFDAHNREELRSIHAHARLGFSDDSINRWLRHANFEIEQGRSLHGGELTVKIWVANKSALPQIYSDPEHKAQTARATG